MHREPNAHRTISSLHTVPLLALNTAHTKVLSTTHIYDMGLGSGMIAIPAASVYHRSYPPLKRPIFSFMWRMLTVFASSFAVMYTLPWQAVKAIAPGGMKNTMTEIEHKVMNVVRPFLNFWQDAWYHLFAIADNLACTVRTNLEHFSQHFSRDVGNLGNYVLSVLEDRTSILQDFGIYGFPIIFHAGLARSALSTTPGMAAGMAKSAANGVSNRIARMGENLSNRPTGPTHISLAQGFTNVY